MLRLFYVLKNNTAIVQKSTRVISIDNFVFDNLVKTLCLTHLKMCPV